MDEYSTWLRVGKTYRCGCCLKMPTFVDICDLKVCPNCQHIMKWYETDHGIFPLRFDEGDEENDQQED